MLDFHGKTALVTGASAGIGREIARLLGREVKALILVARRRERLDELGEELRRARPELQVVVHAVDLGNRDETGAVLDMLDRDGIEVDVFINNAGFGDYAPFIESDWDKLEQMLELNVVSATFLLQKLVPKMVRRGFGAILNVGSTAGMVATPVMSVYGASKAYLNALNEALAAELDGTGVVMTALCPGPVPTEFQQVAGTVNRNPLPKAFYVDAVSCAEQALRGLKQGKTRVIPGAQVRSLMVAVESMPKVLVRPFLKQMARRKS